MTICMPSASSVAIVSYKDGTSIDNHHRTMYVYIYIAKLVCMYGCMCIYIYIHMGSRSHDKYETQGKETMIC